MNQFKKRATFGVLSVVLLGLGVIGCSGDEGSNSDFGRTENVTIQIFPENHIFQSIRLGEPSTTIFQVQNVSSDEAAVLQVFETLVDTGGSTDFQVSCDVGEQFELQVGQAATCSLTFTPTTSAEQSGTITFGYNKGSEEAVGVFSFGTQQLQARIEAVVPDGSAKLNLTAREGNSDTKLVRIRNVGEFPLNVSGFEIASQEGIFTAEINPAIGYGTVSEGSPLRLDPYTGTVGIEDASYKNSELQILVTYAPETTGSDESQLLVRSDDPSTPVLSVDLNGSSDAPCILVVEGTRIDFGDSRIGDLNQKTVSIQNCGTAALEISRIEPGDATTAMIDDTEATSAVFLLDAGSERPVDNSGFLENPIVIEPSETDTFVVGYAPLVEEPNVGKAFVHSNDTTNPRVQLDFFGRGVINQCPTAVGQATIEGESIPPSTEVQAKPLDVLQLDGTQSFDSDGQVEDYEWTIVERPDGSVAEVEVTSLGQADLFLDLAGRFVIELRAIDNAGTPSCEAETITVLVVPSEAIHVQLVWNNPQDSDQTDINGSDIDLHFVKMGPGTWNDTPYDTYWLNTEPFWNPENPSLDRDDTNGAGPENVNLDDPTPCTWYAIGVYYFRQQFATAYTTVRIFVNGLLVFEYLNKPLQQTGDWWDVARIHWPTGDVIMVDEVGTQLPRGQAPPVNQGMIDSANCGVDELLPDGGE